MEDFDYTIGEENHTGTYHLDGEVGAPDTMIHVETKFGSASGCLGSLSPEWLAMDLARGIARKKMGVAA